MGMKPQAFGNSLDLKLNDIICGCVLSYLDTGKLQLITQGNYCGVIVEIDELSVVVGAWQLRSQ